jgi:mono/diheme cytochrome c family protein
MSFAESGGRVGCYPVFCQKVSMNCTFRGLLDGLTRGSPAGPGRARARPEGCLIISVQPALSARLWSWLFNADQRFQPNPARSPEWNRGAYVSEALAHCGECHTPRNLAFALNNRREFGGAVTAGWRAYNITSDAKTGVGEWNDDITATYLAQGHAWVAARPPARWARRWMRA